MDERTRVPDGPAPVRDWSGLVILAVLSALEVAILWVLIAVETPAAPVARRAIEHPIGLVTVVLFALSVLIVAMWAFTSWAEWYHRKRGDGP